MCLLSGYAAAMFAATPIAVDPPKTGFHPGIALEIAESALAAKFGQSAVSTQRPFSLRLTKDGQDWIIEGTQPRTSNGGILLGGQMFVRVRMRDARVLEAFRWR